MPNTAAGTEVVRSHLLNRPSVRWYAEKVQPNGSKGWEMKHYGMPNPTITHVLAATRPIAGTTTDRNLIEWTQQEIRFLLKKAVNWWDADKPGLALDTDTRELHAAAKDLVPFFQVVIMPHLERNAVDEWAAIERVMTELEVNGISTIGCLPAMLVTRPEQADAVANRIRTALQKGTQEDVVASSEAIRCWAVLAMYRKAPKMPTDLLDEICNRIALRQEPGLHSIIASVARIVHEAPKQLNTNQVDALCRGLEYLREETRLPSEKERVVGSIGTTRIPVEERPLYRVRSAWLAFELYNYFQTKNSPVPAVLENWKETCQQDPLPEVRRAWR